MRPQVIMVTVERGPTGAFHARSPDLKGLFVLENTLPELRLEVPRVIESLFAASQHKITARSIDHPSEKFLIFVAVPDVEELDLCA